MYKKYAINGLYKAGDEAINRVLRMISKHAHCYREFQFPLNTYSAAISQLIQLASLLPFNCNISPPIWS